MALQLLQKCTRNILRMVEIQMTSNNNIHINGKSQSRAIKFDITETIENLGIKEIILQDRDLLITWSNERNSCIDFNFKSSSISQSIKKIKNIIKKEVRVDNNIF